MLTSGYAVIDYQATPSGYYQISFRSLAGETMTVTQHGRGGSNFYTPHYLKAEFDEWLSENAQLAIDHMTEMGMTELAKDVKERIWEWQDTIVLTIANLIELGIMTVEG